MDAERWCVWHADKPNAYSAPSEDEAWCLLVGRPYKSIAGWRLRIDERVASGWRATKLTTAPDAKESDRG